MCHELILIYILCTQCPEAGEVTVPGVALVTVQGRVGAENRPDIDTGNVTAPHHNMEDRTVQGHLFHQTLYLATPSLVKVMS
jgi:hypothetical protein